ncbi:hypothetical protein CapIbe_010755 [Capra ibex]
MPRLSGTACLSTSSGSYVWDMISNITILEVGYLQTSSEDAQSTEVLFISTSFHFQGQTESGHLCAA